MPPWLLAASSTWEFGFHTTELMNCMLCRAAGPVPKFPEVDCTASGGENMRLAMGFDMER